MAIYNYSDFESALKSSGLAGQFSQADMNLAMKNADAGMAILSAKKNYMNAKTPEAKALANAEAESVRKSYGGYSGGSNGGSFNLEPLSPGSYSFSEAPKYQDKYGYSERVNAALTALENRQPFTYDAASDPVYQQYDKKYTREGQLTTEDVLGKAAVMTGGAPSTAAITAAGQTANQYAAAKADIIPTLYQQAYERAMAEFEADRGVLNDLMNADQLEYGKYQTELNQHNIDEQNKYGQLLDEISQQTQLRGETTEADRYTDTLKQQDLDNQYREDLRQDELKQQQYENWLSTQLRQDDLNQKELDNQYREDLRQDELEQQQYENWLSTQLRQDEQEQLEKDNARADRELQLKETSTALEDRYTEEQIKKLQNSSSEEDNATAEEAIATYGAMYTAGIQTLKSEGVPEELRDALLDYETWARLSSIGYDGYDAWESYDKYVDDMIAYIKKEAQSED